MAVLYQKIEPPHPALPGMARWRTVLRRCVARKPGISQMLLWLCMYARIPAEGWDGMG